MTPLTFVDVADPVNCKMARILRDVHENAQLVGLDACRRSQVTHLPDNLHSTVALDGIDIRWVVRGREVKSQNRNIELDPCEVD